MYAWGGGHIFGLGQGIQPPSIAPLAVGTASRCLARHHANCAAREAVGPEGQVVPQQMLARTTAPVFKPGKSVGSTSWCMARLPPGAHSVAMPPSYPRSHDKASPRRTPIPRMARAPQTNHLRASGVSARQLQPAGGRGVGGASWPWPCNKLWARPRLAKPGPQPRSGPPGTRRGSESSTWLTAQGQPSHPCGRPRSLVTSADQTGSCRRKRAVLLGTPCKGPGCFKIRPNRSHFWTPPRISGPG